jgi:DNA-binding transcriptional LysR family regulator
VSRAVARLESRVGVRLLDRTTRSIALTDEGRRLYGEIGPLLTGIEDAFTLTAGSSAVVRGRLRVNVDAFFSNLILALHTGRFLDQYPEISLELVTRDQLGDVVGDGFDLAIRFGQTPSFSLISPKLLETRTVTVAAPSYFERYGLPTHPTDLEAHHCIQIRGYQTGEVLDAWEYRRGRKVVAVKTAGRLCVTEFGTMLGACLAGVGIARIKAIGVQRFLDQGSLAAAVLGIYGNSKEEAMYSGYYVDGDGKKPDGANKYTVHFAAGQLPPVNAFWSLTMYDLPASLLVANPINRYLLNAPMLPQFVKDADGGITFYFQNESPGKDKEPNWLPAPKGPFVIALRLYWPKEAALDGTWKQPSMTASK